jgi:hypothetical protein
MILNTRHAIAVLGALALNLVACDRFWHLSVTSFVPTPLSTKCVLETLQGLEGADSVWVRRYTPDTARLQETKFLVWSQLGTYGWFVVTQELGADSLKLGMAASWVGPRPMQDSVESLAQGYSRVISHVAKACWGRDAYVVIEWPR